MLQVILARGAEALTRAVDELTRDRSAMSLAAAYTKELYTAKCAVLFEHVYESYFGDGGSVYRAQA